MEKTILIVLLGMFLLVVISGCVTTGGRNTITNTEIGGISAKGYEGKKILYIDSYHEGYEWSDGITRGIITVLNTTGAELKIHRMDTKRNQSEEFKKQAGLKAKSIIEEFRPDVVLVSDDNAFKYVVMGYYKDAELPFVFCGLNWDASLYGAPYKNTAGMVEVSLTKELIKNLQEYAKGERIGYLSADTETERKNSEYYKKLFAINFTSEYFVTTLDDWKGAFLKLQDEADILIFENNAGINDWNDTEAEAFVLEKIKIPVGTTNPWTMQSSLIGLTKIPEEQGEWSAQTALKIIDGTAPYNIPLVTNKRGRVLVNMKIAEKLNVTLRPDLLKNAEIIK
ncbi:MAG: ABC transporter substrate-binding protein [Nanoarchaeota archaeon]|nr:ABC transporter substrate-binding protein [Nanoarchaeota archaeon]